MNYRHAFHAGNFADVVKHVVLVRILTYLQRKPAALRVIDTHAGAGLYDLASEEAQRTGEWRSGVGQLASIASASPAGILLAPYRALIADTPPHGPQLYPGSPKFVQALLRPTDRAIFCETQDDVRRSLSRAVGRDRRVKVLDLDGWTALRAFVPPPERRGLVLVDPPFESPDEFTRLANHFCEAFSKWPTGTFLLWYPVKTFAARDAFLSALAARGAGKLLRVELGIAPVTEGAGLTRAGLIVANAPFVLAEEMRVMMHALSAAMARTEGSVEDWTVAPVGAVP